MKQDKIRTVIADKVREITGLCEIIGNDFDKDTIHQFRVTVKTLRSFLRLLKLHAPQPHLQLTRKFKRLYHIAGTIRDTQLEYEKMSENKVALPEYINKLMYILSAQKKEWKKHYRKKIVRKLEKRLLSLKYEGLHPVILENFFNSKMAAIALISKSASPSDEQVHRMRKEVKDILYSSKLAKQYWKGAHSKLKLYPVKQLDNFAKVAGEYNDNRITLEHIRSFSSPGLDPAEANMIKRITVKEKARLGKEKKNILAIASELILPKKNNE